jgi:hypothetical protein
MFVDPRTNPAQVAAKPPPRLTTDTDALEDLHRFCREGRLYDVERRIQAGRPLQLADAAASGRRGPRSALEIALERGDQALVLLLLVNGYDPNREEQCPLDRALRARRWDLLDLLLEWGADPHRAELEDLFGTYRTDLFERFRALGVELTAGHAIAYTLAEHTSNKPLFGFAKRHREHDPRIQTELNIALGHHACEGNEKGVLLCLWAGADPHAAAPSLRYPFDIEEETDDGEPDEDRFLGFSAVHEACSGGHAGILERLGPDPQHDDFEELYRWARGTAVINVLARRALPRDMGVIIQSCLSWMRMGLREWESRSVLERLFELGVRWEESPRDVIADVRRDLLKLSDQSFIDVVKLLAKDQHCAPEILTELGRTPAMRRRMREVGFLPASPDDRDRHERYRPTRSREVLSRFGIEVPKPKVEKREAVQHLPRTVSIGSRRPGSQQVRLDRAELFERVWSTPVATLSSAWGISGPGLAKACRRLRVPVPPRGYWAKVQAGRHPRRPRLPELQSGEAEEIVVWHPVYWVVGVR